MKTPGLIHGPDASRFLKEIKSPDEPAAAPLGYRQARVIKKLVHGGESCPLGRSAGLKSEIPPAQGVLGFGLRQRVQLVERHLARGMKAGKTRTA